MGSAIAHHQEKLVGSLEVGKKADLIVLDKNILECKSHEIHKAKVLATMVDGAFLMNKLK